MSEVMVEEPKKKESNKGIAKSTETSAMNTDEELDLGCKSFFYDCFICCCGCEKFDKGSGYKFDYTPTGGWINSSDYVNVNNSSIFDSGGNDSFGHVDTNVGGCDINGSNFGSCDNGGGFDSGGCDTGGGFDSGGCDSGGGFDSLTTD
ncbi:unnamed protein product [Danaus chrysippus]|uniref:(African queen) hypothetical protein n=1 Tax=Danaus chrysippus TaxID=151541 RepID=A0A8J2QXB0_9NEOP|nr:unnamed protein product [Danaus chrysippus]